MASKLFECAKHGTRQQLMMIQAAGQAKTGAMCIQEHKLHGKTLKGTAQEQGGVKTRCETQNLRTRWCAESGNG